ncbi:PhzF family phenazine biosynthesis protein, partial [Sulfoacidibacillus ferrooxidans]|uniref:PhzF family phenazine biosynthesis protein n=1 Tax=Sulfoacidibacillus ferrooxidans TaxID=2005001 RepID=UPI001F50E836
VDIPFSVVNSFTSNAFEGNPAAVILNANTLDHETMLRIARQFNLVETTFVLSAPQNSDFDFELRYFTPTEEVSLAIHPTIAALVS